MHLGLVCARRRSSGSSCRCRGAISLPPIAACLWSVRRRAFGEYNRSNIPPRSSTAAASADSVESTAMGPGRKRLVIPMTVLRTSADRPRRECRATGGRGARYTKTGRAVMGRFAASDRSSDNDAGGTAPPQLPLAEALVRSGHDVAILSQPSVRRRDRQAGSAASSCDQ